MGRGRATALPLLAINLRLADSVTRAWKLSETQQMCSGVGVRPKYEGVGGVDADSQPPGVGGRGLSCSLMVLKLELGDLRNDILGQSELVRPELGLGYI